MIDPHQLVRIEAVHRGFLYQHLYAVACLLVAQAAGVNAIVVERDEDIEIVLQNRRIYVQVKTRSGTLTSSDVDGALLRFEALRIEHNAKRRQGSAAFVIAANTPPGPALLAQIARADWPSDVATLWPGRPGPIDNALPAPQPNATAAFAQCASLAATLPFAMLVPETLVWKLAGAVLAAAAGSPPRTDHAFQAVELPSLFEQLVVQLQDFPAPPVVYRAHANEPPLHSLERARIITGYSGSGKTAWVSQAAVHATTTFSYFDVTETPGPALAPALARELAARLFGQTGGRLGEILLPGATGPEILNRIGARLSDSGANVTVVLDNAHRVPAADLQSLIRQGKHFKFVLLSQPSRAVTELEALLGVKAEPLEGWATDTVALEVAAHDCRADFATCQRLAELTGGMPLYVQNAIGIAAAEYGGSIQQFCDDLEAETHVVETAQELILVRVFDAFSPALRNGISVLSLADIPLEQPDAAALLAKTLELDDKTVAALLRQLRSSGAIEIYGGSRLKIHDAMRLLGRSRLQTLGEAVVRRAEVSLKDVLLTSLQRGWELPKLSLYLRLLTAIGDIKTLVQLAADELFHELGVRPEIMAFLESAATSDATKPVDRFWALDGLIFAEMKRGEYDRASQRQDTMARLVADYSLGLEEHLALAMKRMNLLALKGDADGVMASIGEISKLLPDMPKYQRIYRYNAAHALFSLHQYDATIRETWQLIQEYYDLVGIRPEVVLGRNADKIWPLLRRGADLIGNLKHLADCLDLHATAMNAIGASSPFGRIHAMKFYQLANAPDSLVRVGQDLVDEFIARNDFAGAREIIETNLLPNVLKLKMLDRIIPVRSQYAVVLAYCGDFASAEAEMERLAPYEAGLDEKGQRELRNQRRIIARIRLKGPPPQWVPPIARPAMMPRRKIRGNAPCPCGSGRKFKKCHGPTA